MKLGVPAVAVGSSRGSHPPPPRPPIPSSRLARPRVAGRADAAGPL